MDRGAWQAIVLGVAKSWTQLERLSMHYSFVRYYHWGKLGEGCSRAIFTHKTSDIKHVRISPTATYSTAAGCPAIQFSFDTISLRLESHSTSSGLSLMRLRPPQKPVASLRPPSLLADRVYIRGYHDPLLRLDSLLDRSAHRT